MSKAIVPETMPELPEDMNAWARSTKGRGGMFHAHVIGMTACRSIILDRHNSEEPRHLGDMKYWGVCPRCFKLGGNSK